MKNIKENIQIQQLLKDIGASFFYAADVKDKKTAITNLEQVKTLRENTVKAMNDQRNRYDSPGSSFDEKRPKVDPVMKACINDPSVVEFVKFLDSYDATGKLHRITNYLACLRSILEEKLLETFEEVDKPLMLLCFQKLPAGQLASASTFPFLFYVLRRDGCTVLATCLECHPRIRESQVKRERDGKLFFCVDKESYNTDAARIEVKQLEVLEGLNQYPDLFSYDGKFLVKLAKACREDGFLHTAQLACQMADSRETRKEVMDVLLTLKKEDAVHLPEIIHGLWVQVLAAFGEEGKHIMDKLLLMCAALGFHTGMMELFLRNFPNASKESIEEAMESETGFLNVCTGNRYLSLSRKAGKGRDCEMQLVIYAMKDKKHAFLRLAEGHFDMIGDLADNSILFHPDFRQLCNLNTLSEKNLRTLKKEADGMPVYTCDTTEQYLPYLPKGNGYYTFDELAALGNVHENYQKIYRGLDAGRVDKKLILIRQLFHKELKVGQLTDVQCAVVAARLSEKPFTDWKKELSVIKGVEPWQVLKLVSMMDGELIPVIEKAASMTDVNIILNNAGNELLAGQGLENFRSHFLEYDRDSRWLMENLSIPEDMVAEHMDSILAFCTAGHASIVHTYHGNASPEQQKNILLIAKASMLGMMDRLKYDGFEKELKYKLEEGILGKWKENLSVHGHGLKTAEYDDFFHCISIGVLTGHTCMSFEDGAYSECLLSCFDGNKKVLYVKDGDGYRARAILRLTKFSDTNTGTREGFGFRDVTEEERSDVSNQERLVLFLERPYIHKADEKTGEEAVRQMVLLAKKKSELMGIDLVVANGYKNYLDTVPVSGHLYISRSKNGKQYLDSLGGKCERGGNYKSGNFLFWEKDQGK